MTWFGVGWRSVHADAIEAPGATDAVDWFEVLVDAGLPRDRLVRLRGDHPLALHGVHLSIAGDAPVRLEKVARDLGAKEKARRAKRQAAK